MGTDPPASVMVAVRCRPMNTRELNQKEAKIVTIKENGYASVQSEDEMQGLREFSFDYTYDDDSLQLTVYENLGRPMLDKAFDGWNGTIFAYGQTGAGKSFSMTGTNDLPGIIPQMNVDMFQRISQSQTANPEKKFLVTCSFMEIYNEVLYDLLDPSGGRGTNKKKKDSTIEIKEHPVLGVYVHGLQEIAVDTQAKIEALMTQGNEMRAVASTQMNDTSSRSHSIFIIKMQQKEVHDGQQKEVRATINLVDLAGSERVSKTGATGDKLKEGANINKSLSALGNVINALAEQSKKNKKVFIPYRNSKLTRVLQESLGGNSVTVMLAAISPAAYNYEESLNTLQYADRAKAIQLKARKNEQMTEVGKLKAEIEALKAALLAAGGQGPDGVPAGPGGGEGMSDAAKAAMQTQIDDYNLMLKQSFEEKEKLAQEMERERQEMLSRQDEAREQLQLKYEEERRAMLAADSDHWVRLLVASSKQLPQHQAFVSAIEGMEVRRREASDKIRELQAFLSILQAAVEKEAGQYVEKEAARAAAAEADPEAAKAVATSEEVAQKVLLEQLLLKMRNLREELGKGVELRAALVAELEAMESAAGSQLSSIGDEISGAESSAEAAALRRTASDLEMFLEYAAKQRTKVQATIEEGEAGSAGVLAQLKQMTATVDGGVNGELAQVNGRLEVADSGGEKIDDGTRANMEKRVGVLRKELAVLADISGRDELTKVLHGLSQVVHGVIARMSKRLSMRDKAKEKSLQAKEQQVKEARAEAEALRAQLYKENFELKDEVARLQQQNGDLQGLLLERDGCIAEMARAAPQLAATAAAIRPFQADPDLPQSSAPHATTDDAPAATTSHAASATGDAAIDISSPNRRVQTSSMTATVPGGTPTAVTASQPGPYAQNLASLQLSIGGTGTSVEAAEMAGQLQIAKAQAKAVDKQLEDVTALAKKLADEKRYVEEQELVPLRLRAAALEEELRAAAPDAASRVDAAQPAVPQLPPSKISLSSLQLNVVASPSKQVPASDAPSGAVSAAAVDASAPAQTVALTVPDDAVPGSEIVVTAPDGRQVTITVPEGVVAGQELSVQVPAASAPAQTVVLTVPEGAVPGSEIAVTAPDGRQVTITVPEGVVAGQELSVQVPAAGTDTSASAPVDSRGPVAREQEGAMLRELNNDKVQLTLSLATLGSANTSMQCQAAERDLAIEALRAERDQAKALVAQLQGDTDAGVAADDGVAPSSDGAIAADGALPSEGGVGTELLSAVQRAEAQAQLRAMAAQLRDVQAKAAESTQSSRDERLKSERARMELEQQVTALKEERLALQEAALLAEERLLEVQEELDSEKGGALEAKEALMKAEVRLEQQTQKLGLAEGSSAERAEKLQAELEAAVAKAAEAGEEVGSLEEEKYQLVADIEVLEEELEDANAHQKRYYEALMQKEEQLNRHKAQCAALQKAVEKLQYQNEIIELQNNPVGEELDVSAIHEEADKLKSANNAKDRELQKLRAELETMQLTVDEESFEQGSPARRSGAGFGSSHDNIPPQVTLETAPSRGGFGSDGDYGKQQAALEERRANDERRAAMEKLRLQESAKQLTEDASLLRVQLDESRAMARAAEKRADALEAQSRKQEAELLKLMSSRDALDAQHGSKEEELGELQDNLYEVSQQFEEEQERANELQAEADKLRAELQAAQKQMVSFKSLQIELDDEKLARKKAERLLAQATV